MDKYHDSKVHGAYMGPAMFSKAWFGITYSFSNLNESTVDIWKWIGYVTLRFIMNVITYPFVIVTWKFFGNPTLTAMAQGIPTSPTNKSAIAREIT